MQLSSLRVVVGIVLIGCNSSLGVAQEAGTALAGVRACAVVKVRDGRELQDVLDLQAGKDCVVKIDVSSQLTCSVLESRVGDEISRHALMIPEKVILDLNGATLLLDLRSNSHGVRLSSFSGIRNGTIRIIRSENKGSQGIWHSAISVGSTVPATNTS